MSYHKDEEVNRAVIKLLDALGSHERNTGRRNTLLLIPHELDEDLVIAQDGKPLRNPESCKVTGNAYRLNDIRLILRLAIAERYDL